MKQCLVLDIGSTQTKAALFEEDKDWTFIAAGESMTTTGQPYEDAMVGVQDAIQEVEKFCGRKIWDNGLQNVSSVIVQSSAGGGLQMVVAGIVETMTTESARRAALGAGAIITEVISGGTAIKQSERLQKLQQTRPDIILLAGGTEGGNEDQVVALAETIHSAHVQARLGDDLVPVVYAGNSAIQDDIKRYLGKNVPLYLAENIRPSLEDEQVETVNDLIQKIYLENVASRVPGFQNIEQLGTSTIYPTVRNLSTLLKTYAESKDINAMLFDVGSFTTDVYSSIEYVRRAYKRSREGQRTINVNIGDKRERKAYISISADLGLAHSAARLVRKAGVKQVLRWLPSSISSDELLNYGFNKMLNPYDLEQEADELYHQALITECLRLSLLDHQEIAGKLHGVGIVRNMKEAFEQINYNEGTVAERLGIDEMIITGGRFATLDKPEQILQVLIDGLEPEGVTDIYLDRNDCLSRIAGLREAPLQSRIDMCKEHIHKLVTVIAPVGIGKSHRRIAEVVIRIEGQQAEHYGVQAGHMSLIKLPAGVCGEIVITPDNQVDLGLGTGQVWQRTFCSGEYGFVLDGRLRPLSRVSQKQLKKWYTPISKALKEGDLQ